jgi:hypothetical protein
VPKPAFVVTLHFVRTYATPHIEYLPGREDWHYFDDACEGWGNDAIELTCTLSSGAQVLHKSSLRPQDTLATIWRELAGLLPTLVSASFPRRALDGELYDQQAFEMYYGEQAPTIWAEAVHRTVRLVLVLPNGFMLEKDDASARTVCMALRIAEGSIAAPHAALAPRSEPARVGAPLAGGDKSAGSFGECGCGGMSAPAQHQPPQQQIVYEMDPVNVPIPDTDSNEDLGEAAEEEEELVLGPQVDEEFTGVGQV